MSNQVDMVDLSGPDTFVKMLAVPGVTLSDIAALLAAMPYEAPPAGEWIDGVWTTEQHTRPTVAPGKAA